MFPTAHIALDYGFFGGSEALPAADEAGFMDWGWARVGADVCDLLWADAGLLVVCSISALLSALYANHS